MLCSSSSARKERRVETEIGDDQAADKGSGVSILKVEATLKDAVDVEPSGTDYFDKDTKAAYDWLRTSMLKSYCSVYTSDFEETIEEHNDWSGEDVSESVNLILADPSYNTRGY